MSTNNMQLIMENWRKYNDSPFHLMCERFDRNLLTEEELCEKWQEDALLEFEILNEAFGGIGKAVKGAVDTALQKANDWLLEKSLQLIDLAKRAGERALGSIKWLLDKVSGFCDRWPAFCKVVRIVLIAAIVFIVSSVLFSDDASAAISQGGNVMDDQMVNIFKGYVHASAEAAQEVGNEEAYRDYIKVIAHIDEYHNAEGVHDILEAKEGIDTSIQSAWQAMKKKLTGADPFDYGPGSGNEWLKEHALKKWVDIGERVSAWYQESTTGFVDKVTGHGSISKSFKGAISLADQPPQ